MPTVWRLVQKHKNAPRHSAMRWSRMGKYAKRESAEKRMAELKAAGYLTVVITDDDRQPPFPNPESS